ncbi:MAG: peptidase [Nitrospiraceae bacterium]|nr:MAG: peptidase [Nitrospiraceae bacterium]
MILFNPPMKKTDRSINKTDKVIYNIFSINLGIKNSEKVLVIGDGYNQKLKEIGRRITETGKIFSKDIKYLEYKPTGCHGIEPPEEIWKEAFGNSIYTQIKKKNYIDPLIAKRTSDKQNREIEGIIRKYKKETVDAVIALSYFSTSHTRFRNYLNTLCGTRYASMPLFDEEMLEGAMRVDWNRMKKRTETIASYVNKVEWIEVETPNGTSIRLSKKGRKALADTGIITRSGAFSNLPAGEVFLAPVEGTAQGKLVLEWAPTSKLKKPVTLYVEKGMVIKAEGKDNYLKYLIKMLKENRLNANIAELGIGTNDKAKRPDNILESEKIFGTIHIALGDNSTFGGKVRTPFHQDFVFFKPTVTLIDKYGKKKLLLRKGKPALQAIVK